MLNWFMVLFIYTKALPVAQLVKHLLQCGRDLGSIPGSGSFPGEGNCNPLHTWRNPWTEEPGRLQFMGRQELDMT